MLRAIGNILWLVLGGAVLGLGYVVAGVVMCILIVTIPFGLQSFKLASYTFWPFGRVVVDDDPVKRQGCLSVVGNIIWLVFGGLWMAIGHLIAAVLNAITIIGIPFAVVHVKLARISLTPFGHRIVTVDEAKAQSLHVAVSTGRS